MPPRLWMVSGASRGAALGQAGFLSCWFLAGEGVSGDGQPCSDRGLLSKCSLADAASIGGGAGAGSWCFINRVSVANGAKDLGTVVPTYGQVSLYNLPVLGLMNLAGVFFSTEGVSTQLLLGFLPKLL